MRAIGRYLVKILIAIICLPPMLMLLIYTDEWFHRCDRKTVSRLIDRLKTEDVRLGEVTETLLRNNYRVFFNDTQNSVSFTCNARWSSYGRNISVQSDRGFAKMVLINGRPIR
jgi:hypothetical protein